jgi:nucleoside-triphosphatase
MGGIWLLTGPPGVGKTTAVSKVVLKLMSAGVIVGGCTTSEKRTGGARVGFVVKDLSTGRLGELASTTSRFGPKVGKYRVNLVDLAAIGGGGLMAAAKRAEAIVIDEVGPMELVSPEFKRGVRACVDSGRPILAVIHERIDDDILNELRSKAAETFNMSVENRHDIADKLEAALMGAVGGSKSG